MPGGTNGEQVQTSARQALQPTDRRNVTIDKRVITKPLHDARLADIAVAQEKDLEDGTGVGV